MKQPWHGSLDIVEAPILEAFLLSNTTTRFIIGPVGSGKTVSCCFEVVRRGLEQTPSPHDGLRRFKAAIVRNTMPELWRTTIETWLAKWPENIVGPMRRSSPVRHHLYREAQNWNRNLPHDHPDQGTPGFDILVEFFALDKVQDVKSLLSWEGTLIYFNEVREIPKAIIDAAGDRIGRFPSMEKGSIMPDWFGMIGDTNPPDEDHWLYNIHILEKPAGFAVFHQPPGLIEVERKGTSWVAKAGEPDLITTNDKHVVTAPHGSYAVNPNAENLANLPLNLQLDPSGDQLGPGGYYLSRVPGKRRDHIRCYYQGRYGFVLEGKPIVPEFNEDTHITDQVPIVDGPIGGGLDIGGGTLQPGAAFGQRHPRGIWLIHGETAAKDLDLNTFSTLLKQDIAEIFPEAREAKFYADPAGNQRSDTDIFMTSAIKHMRSKGLPTFPAPTNDWKARENAIRAPFNRMIDGKPGILIHKRCRSLIKGLHGAWCYRRVQVAGAERYAEQPEKTHPESDVCDAATYWLLGGGESREMKRPSSGSARTPPSIRRAKVKVNPWG